MTKYAAKLDALAAVVQCELTAKTLRNAAKELRWYERKCDRLKQRMKELKQ